MIDLKKYKGIIFDLDGTLIDSLWVWNQIDIDFLGKRGFDVPKDYLDNISHMGFEACADYTIERFSLNETRDSVVKEWFDMAIDAYSNKVKIKNGVKEFLEYLKNNNIKMSIATASDLQLVIPVLKSNNIDEYFDNITTVSEVKKGKGFPDVYDLAAKRMGIKSTKCIVFEDIIKGIEGAKAGGYFTVCVHDDNSHETIEELNAISDMFIYDFRECIGLEK